MYLAAVNGSAVMIARLLDAGADPNEVGTEGETVLMTAARTGSVEIIQTLVARGADVNAIDGVRVQRAQRAALVKPLQPGHAVALDRPAEGRGIRAGAHRLGDEQLGEVRHDRARRGAEEEPRGLRRRRSQISP